MKSRRPVKTKAGEWVFGICKYCPEGQNAFRYQYYRKIRTVCDKCLANNKRENTAWAKGRVIKPKPKPGDQFYQDRSQKASTEHAFSVARKTIHNGSELLHLSAEKTATVINRILSGEDLYVSRR